MQSVYLLPSSIVPGHYTPAGESDIIILRSFGFYDYHVSNHRSLESWKEDRTSLGLNGILRIFIPA